jgi:hypothetical protein
MHRASATINISRTVCSAVLRVLEMAGWSSFPRSMVIVDPLP